MVNCWIYRKKKKDLPVPERWPCGRLKRDEGRSSRCHPFFKRRANGAPSFSPCVLRGGRSGSRVSFSEAGARRASSRWRASLCGASGTVPVRRRFSIQNPEKLALSRLSSSGSECFSSPDRRHPRGLGTRSRHGGSLRFPGTQPGRARLWPSRRPSGRRAGSACLSP